MKTLKPRQGAAPGFAELYTPKLVTVLREGYGLQQLRADAIVGLTVAIVALPLSMAIAIASGATPAQGIHTAIVGGFLVSLPGAPFAAYIPLAGLVGGLAVVAWNMIEKPAIVILGRSGWGELTVLCATFFLTLFRDLTEAIIVGFALGSVLFIQRMSRTTAIETHTPFVGHDEADTARLSEGGEEALAADPDLVVYRITGALFFGATASIDSVLDRIQDSHKALIVDFTSVPFRFRSPRRRRISARS